MRLMVMGESFAFVRASTKIFSLILRLTWGFITILDSLGSLTMLWQEKKRFNNWLYCFCIPKTDIQRETYSNTTKFLFHLIEVLLLTGSREQGSCISSLDPIDLDRGLEKNTRIKKHDSLLELVPHALVFKQGN